MPKPRCSTALVVVDMQRDFAEACKEPSITGRGSVLSAAEALIQCAARDRVPVIFVEYKFCGPTYRSLRFASEGTRSTIVYKNRNDGSREVLDGCRTLRIRPKHFVVCGVHYTACVYETVYGLHDRRPFCDITLVRDATNFYDSPNAENAYARLDRVKMVDIYKQPALAS